MTGISRIDKLNLFKQLLKYSNQLIYTDRQFYLNRVKQEFNKNKELTNQKDITFFYQKFAKKYLIESIESNQAFRQILLNFSTNSRLNGQKIDKSKVPVLNERDLKEEFIHGSGPGGQNVNKLSNCVQLTHLPTGIVVKCHQDRLQQRNRKIARELLVSKLDDLINGDQSVSAQRSRMIISRLSKRDKSREKLRELKKQFKEEELLRKAVPENDSDVSRNN